MPKITAQLVEKIKPDPARRVEIPDSLLPGLYLVVQPSGAKSWAVRYRHAGRTRKYTLDIVARLPLGEARDRAREALQVVSAGRDPAFERKAARSGDQDLIRNVVPTSSSGTFAPTSRPAPRRRLSGYSSCTFCPHGAVGAFRTWVGAM